VRAQKVKRDQEFRKGYGPLCPPQVWSGRWRIYQLGTEKSGPFARGDERSKRKWLRETEGSFLARFVRAEKVKRDQEFRKGYGPLCPPQVWSGRWGIYQLGTEKSGPFARGDERSKRKWLRETEGSFLARFVRAEKVKRDQEFRKGFHCSWR